MALCVVSFFFVCLLLGLPEYGAGDVCLRVLVSSVCFPALLLSAALSAVS